MVRTQQPTESLAALHAPLAATTPIPTAGRCPFPADSAPVRSKQSYGAHPPFMPPLDDSTARAHPVFRGTEPAPRDQYSYPEGTAKRCPCPDDSAPHGNARHIRL